MNNSSVDEIAKMDSKKIKELIQAGELEEAIKLAEKYPHDHVIQSQRITIAFMQNDLETAREISQRPEFKEKRTIYSQRIKLALLQRKYDETENLIKEARELDSRILGSYKKSLRIQLKNDFLDKVRNNNVSKSDIQEIEKSRYLTEYDKACLLLAFCDRTENLSVAKRIYNQYKSSNHDLDELRKIEKVMQCVRNRKTKIFEYEFYKKMLGIGRASKNKKDR